MFSCLGASHQRALFWVSCLVLTAFMPVVTPDHRLPHLRERQNRTTTPPTTIPSASQDVPHDAQLGTDLPQVITDVALEGSCGKPQFIPWNGCYSISSCHPEDQGFTPPRKDCFIAEETPCQKIKFNGNQLYPSGTKVYFKCNQGFKISGPRAKDCHSSRWIPAGWSYCEPDSKVTTSIIAPVLSSQVVTDVALEGSCGNPQFLPHHGCISSCQPEDQGVTPPPQDCFISEQSNGTCQKIAPDQLYPTGSKVLLKCDQGYKISGAPVKKCQFSRWMPTGWSSCEREVTETTANMTEPTVEPVNVRSTPRPRVFCPAPNFWSSNSWFWPIQARYDPGDELFIECKAGYIFEIHQSANVPAPEFIRWVCRKSIVAGTMTGIWRANFTRFSCVWNHSSQKTTPSPSSQTWGCLKPISADRHLQISPDLTFYDILEEIRYSCKYGYYLSGGATSSRCEGGGRWSQRPPTCHPHCPAPAKDSNGEYVVTPCNLPYLGTRHCLKIYCDGGYTSHNTDSYCLYTGRWTSVPRCIEDDGVPREQYSRYVTTALLAGLTLMFLTVVCLVAVWYRCRYNRQQQRLRAAHRLLECHLRSPSRLRSSNNQLTNSSSSTCNSTNTNSSSAWDEVETDLAARLISEMYGVPPTYDEACPVEEGGTANPSSATSGGGAHTADVPLTSARSSSPAQLHLPPAYEEEQTDEQTVSQPPNYQENSTPQANSSDVIISGDNADKESVTVV